MFYSVRSSNLFGLSLFLFVSIFVIAVPPAFADYNVTISSAASTNGSWSGGSPDVWTPSASGSNVSVADIQTRLAAGVTITTAGGGAENGDIVINDAVSWSADTTFTLSAYRNVNVNANLTATGNTAGLVLTPNIGSGGGTYSLNSGAVITLSGATPSLTIAGNAYTVINSVTALQNMGSGLSGRYVLGSNIDASATSTWNSNAGFEPVGYLGDANYTTTNFTGAFDGLGHTITGLTINRPTAEYVGLFGLTFVGATIKNVGLVGGSVTGSVNVGELVGCTHGGTITNAYSTGSVTGGNSIGGLVGYNGGGATITNSYSTGVVSGGNAVGGLAGSNGGNATITNAYSTGSASGGEYVGGLVGSHEWGTITNSYSTGAVSGSGANVGGLVGIKGGAATISYSYWDTQTSGQATGSFGTGLTTAQMMQQSNFSGWDFTGTWVIYEGYTYPLLRSFPFPDLFLFTPVTNAAITTSYESNSITVSGINVPVTISIRDGEYSISTDNGSNWSAYSTTTPTTVNLNDKVKVQVTSSSSPSTVVTATLTIGTVSAGFNVTTLPAHTVTGQAVPPSGGNVACTSPALEGPTTTCDITANANYHVTTIAAGPGCGRTPIDYTYTVGTGNSGTTTVTSFATGAVMANCTVTADFALDSYTVTGTSTGGSGGIVCDSPVLYDRTSTCTLSPSSGWFTSIVTDNSGSANGWSSTSYTIQSVTEGHSVQVQFAEYPVKRISSSTVYHMTIQEAYNAAADSGDIIQALATSFGGGLSCGRQNVSVTIQGGFDSGYGTNPGFTVINTGLTISDGEVTVERVEIE